MDQANRELAQRFDFKDTGAKFELKEFVVTLHAQVEFQLKQMLDILKERRDAACELVNTVPGMHVAGPQSTFYLFPDVTDAVQRMGYPAVGDFATAALHQTGVSFCTREHFGRRQPGEERQYIRLAYSGIDVADIRDGLGRLRKWIETA